MENKKYNFVNIIKFFSAILVIYSHSFALSAKSEDFLSVYSHGYIGLGAVAVTIFFAFSGFFITKSIKHDEHFFFRKRIKKVFPCLFVTVFLCVIVFSTISEDGIFNYFRNKQTYLYLLNSIGIPIHDLPGVFLHNIYGRTVNGALWTIIVEIGCYVSSFILCKLHLLEKNRFSLVVVVLLIGCMVCHVVLEKLNIPILQSMLRPFLVYSFSGWLFINFELIKKHAKKILVASLVISFILIIINLSFGYDFLLIFCLPSILIILILRNIEHNISFGVFERISYQMYLLGFPIQQTIVYLFGGSMNPYLNFILSLGVVIPFAFLLWYFFDHKLNPFYDKLLKIC